MKKIYSLALVLAIMAMFVGCSKGPASGKTLVKINGEKITEGDLNFLTQINPRIQMQIASPEGKQRILDNLIEQDLLYQEAVKQGINRESTVKAKIDLYRRVIIAQSLVDSEIDKAAKKYYDEHPEEFKKLKMSHIFVKFASPDELAKAKKGKDAKPMHSEADALKIANDAKAMLDKGEAFDAVAKDVSEDPMTKTRGGDLGAVAKDDKRFAAKGYGPLIEKAFEMKVGEVSGPIKTQDGYHIITVTRGIEVENFDESKEALLLKVRGDSRLELLARLKKDAKIVYADDIAKNKAAEEAKKITGGEPPVVGGPAAPSPSTPPVIAPPAKPAGTPPAPAPSKADAPAEKPAGNN